MDVCDNDKVLSSTGSKEKWS